MPSIQYKLVRTLFKSLGVNKMLAKEGEDFRKLLDKYDKEQKKPLKIPYKKLEAGFEIDSRYINGTLCHTVKARGSEPQIAVLYLFGGGYILPPDPGDIVLCSEIAENCNAEVWFPLYPMAPSHRLVQTLESSLAVYKEILKNFNPEEVRFFGTSSGGGQAMSLCSFIKHVHSDTPLPGRLVLQSPGLQVPPSEAQKAKMESLSDRDVMIPPVFFDNIAPVLATGDEAYLLSPVLDDLTGFPPIDIFYGTEEVMIAYLEDLKDACSRYGVPLNVHIGEGMMHCWGAMSFVPEAQAVRREYFAALSDDSPRYGVTEVHKTEIRDSALDKKDGIRKNLALIVGAAKAEQIWARAEEILLEIEHRYEDIPKGQKMHTSYIFPSAAIQLASVEILGDREPGYKAISEYSWAKSRKMGDSLRRMSRIPGFNNFFVKLWDPISRKSFGPDAGFSNVFYPNSRGEYRMDITKCPYNSYFTELGTPELTKIFCINDECTYGDVPGLEFTRHTTLGIGGDKCDFYIRVAEDEAKPEARIWDRFAPIYETAMKKDGRIYKWMCGRIREVIAGREVLELACGPGIISKRVADAAGSMIATDFSHKMIAQAKKGKNPVNLTYEWADATDLQYEDGSFDVVIIGNALHVVPEPRKVLAEIRRVLRPGGILIAPTFIHKGKDKAAAVTSRLLELAGIEFGSKWSEEDFAAVLEESGFNITYTKILKASINEMYVECSRI